MIKIIHIITGLGSGGAENMLYKLLKYSDKEKYYHEVISLIDEGTMGSKIKGEGIKVHSLNISKTNLISSLFKTKSLCQDFDIVNTWLYHADIFGFIIAKLILRKKLIWNIRHSNLDKNANKLTTLKIAKINSLLSQKVDFITYNSKKAFETHKEAGYLNKNSLIIPNGFELDNFKFNEVKRDSIRKELLIGSEEKVLITVGRWDIQKDYHMLLRALNELSNSNIKFKMLMIGTKLDNDNRELMGLITQYNLKNQILLLGIRDDIPAFLSAADIYVSSSLGESFSNAIGEAMSCELTCVVTDVGDSKSIVGNTGDIVKSRDFKGLALKLQTHIEKTKIERNRKARKKVIDEYDIKQVTRYIEDNIWIK